MYPLTEIAMQNGPAAESLQFLDCEIDPEKIKVIMISEVPPKKPDTGFYSISAASDYMKSILGLFAVAGVRASSINDILNTGIYITTLNKPFCDFNREIRRRTRVVGIFSDGNSALCQSVLTRQMQ